MRHRVRSTRLTTIRDKSNLIRRAMMISFVVRGTLTTTQKKARVIRTGVDIVVNRAKQKTESAKNYLLSTLEDTKTISLLTDQIAPLFKDRVGGYTRVLKLPQRVSDGASMARIEWVTPVVFQKAVKEKKVKLQKTNSSSKAVAKTKSVKQVKKIKK